MEVKIDLVFEDDDGSEETIACVATVTSFWEAEDDVGEPGGFEFEVLNSETGFVLTEDDYGEDQHQEIIDLIVSKSSEPDEPDGSYFD